VILLLFVFAAFPSSGERATSRRGGRERGGNMSRKRRLLLRLPMVFLLMVLAAFGTLWLRGTWADSVPVDPGTTAEGPVCRVYQAPGEPRLVRCSLRLPFALEEVWEVVTDYDSYGDICDCITAGRVAHDPNRTCRVEGTVLSGLGPRVPFSATMRHEEGLEEYTASWDDPGGDVTVNRGRWVLRPAGPRETLVVLTLEVEVRGIPTFLLRNLSLQRLPQVLLGLQRRLETGGSGKSWSASPP
jgi:hypothetical protein